MATSSCPRRGAQRGGVGDEAVAKGNGIERGEDAAESVVAGRAMGQLEPLAQPVFPLLGEALEVLEIVHATDHGGQRDEEDLAEVMTLGAAAARIC